MTDSVLTWQGIGAVACVFLAWVVGVLVGEGKRPAMPTYVPEEASEEAQIESQEADYDAIQQAWDTYCHAATPEERRDAGLRYCALADEFDEVYGVEHGDWYEASCATQSSDSDYAVRAAWCDGRQGVVLGNGSRNPSDPDSGTCKSDDNTRGEYDDDIERA